MSSSAQYSTPLPATDPHVCVIERDHLQLMEICAAATAHNPAENCPGRGICDACPDDCACQRDTREQFHRILFACLGRFGREEEVLRKLLPREEYQRHVESHADIMSLVQQAITAFSKSGNVPVARDRMAAIARAYETHRLMLDSRYIQIRIPANPSRCDISKLPLTGDLEIDAEHASLHDMLLQAAETCTAATADCACCHADRRQHCLDRTTEVIGSLLGYMVEHFRHEEMLIRGQRKHAGMDLHLAAHAEIAQQLGQMIDQYEDQNTARCLQRLIGTLDHWLQDHILRFDIPLVAEKQKTAADCPAT